MKAFCRAFIAALRVRHQSPLPPLHGNSRPQGIITLINLPTAQDIRALAALRLPLEGLVVALEIRPLQTDQSLLLGLHRQVIDHLQPLEAVPPVGQERRTATDGKVMILGQRSDPVHLCCYPRLSEAGRPLPPDEHASRVDAVFLTAACRQLGLRTTAQLLGFNFRHKLSPYFHFSSPTGDSRAAVRQDSPPSDPAWKQPCWPNPNRGGGEALRRLTLQFRHTA